MSDKKPKITINNVHVAGRVYIDPELSTTHEIKVDGKPVSEVDVKNLNGPTKDAETNHFRERRPLTSTPYQQPKQDMPEVAELEVVKKQPTLTPQPRLPVPYIDLRRFNEYNTKLLEIFGRVVKNFKGQGKDVDLRCKFVVAADFENLVFDHKPLVDEWTVVCSEPHNVILGATLEVTEAHAPFNGFMIKVNNTADLS